MQFLRDNKRLLYALLLLPVFFLYLDRSVMLWLRSLKNTHAEVSSFLRAIDPAVNLFYYGVIVAVVFLVVLKKFIRKDLWKTLFAGIIITSLSLQAKHLFGRARPKLGYDTVFAGPSLKYAYSSFPSGHTTFVFMLSNILSSFYPKYRFLFYGFALWVGFERIEDTAHFLSDVIGGAILGLLVGRFVLYKFGKINFTDYAKKQ